MSGSTPFSKFKAFKLLQDCPDDLIQELARSAQAVSFKPQQAILTQGQINQHLYFLAAGSVEVLVDGKLVSKLSEPGCLLGEMSVINSQLCGATILCSDQVEVFSVDVTQFGDAAWLQKIFARVLADKLHQTNQKAKMFEELTVQLKAAQIELEELQKQKGLDDARSQSSLLRRVNEVYENELKPRQATLTSDPAWQSTLKIFDSVHKIYSSSQTLHRKKVLVADSQKKQQMVAKLALGGTGVDLEIVSSLEEATEFLAKNKIDLIFVDSNLLPIVDFVQKNHPQVEVVLLTSENVQSYHSQLSQLSKIPHIVSRNEADKTFSIKNILTTVTKLSTHDIFGLEKYLNWGVEVQSASIEKSSQRPELIAQMDSYLAKLGLRSAQRDRIRLVLEELLMNAIYDAPIDASGKSLFNHLPRSQEVVLGVGQHGVLNYACDGTQVAISVQDPFGSFRPETLLKYLERSVQEASSELNAAEGKGGAGKGLHLIVHSSDLVVFNLAPKIQSEVIAIFNLDIKETAHLSPSFHLFLQTSRA